MSDKEAFEAWFARANQDGELSMGGMWSSDLAYLDSKAALLKAWQAASALRQSEVERLREALDVHLPALLDSMKFHPSASHVHPEYRDGYNHALSLVLERLATECELQSRAALGD